MERKEFLKLLGLGAAGTLALYCTGCKKSSMDTTAPSNVDFTLNLDDAANAPLKQAGGYIYNQRVIVARAANGDYIAVSQACTHEGTAVTYQVSSNQFHCDNHGSNFSTSGAAKNGPASSPLRQYNTTLSGNRLRVFS